jgi:hypothetical protein
MGPIAIPSPIMPPQAPVARARCPGSRKTSLRMHSDDGIVRAAPTPIKALEGIRISTIAWTKRSGGTHTRPSHAPRHGGRRARMRGK